MSQSEENKNLINIVNNGLGSKAFGRRDSLLIQANVDCIQNEFIRQESINCHRKKLENHSTLCKQLIQRLNDTGLDLLMQKIDINNSDLILHLSIIFTFSCDSHQILSLIIQKLTLSGIKLIHLETRPDKVQYNELELLIECKGAKSIFLNFLTKISIEKQNFIKQIQLNEILKKNSFDSQWKIDNFAIESNLDEQSIWFPKHVSELDLCAHVVVKYEPTEDPKHPGFGDKKYIARRSELNKIANTYRFGEILPIINYTEEENETWRLAYNKLKKLRNTHTCIEYQENIAKMEAENLITPNAIPQLKAINSYIQKRTGFELRPCGGLLSARDFLASLAFRVFQSTLYVRHQSKPNHCPEPDVIHEILGHCPMFADPYIAEMSQEIGLISLGATDEQIERLSTVYWFIIEFGLCRQNGKLKAIGAGLISAYGELQYSCSNTPTHEPFIPEITALRTYEDSNYQPVYFVTESIKNALEKIRIYARKLCPNYSTIYSPLTRTVERLPINQILKRELNNLIDEAAKIRQLLNVGELTYHIVPNV